MEQMQRAVTTGGEDGYVIMGGSEYDYRTGELRGGLPVGVRSWSGVTESTVAKDGPDATAGMHST